MVDVLLPACRVSGGMPGPLCPSRSEAHERDGESQPHIGRYSSTRGRVVGTVNVTVGVTLNK